MNLNNFAEHRKTSFQKGLNHIVHTWWLVTIIGFFSHFILNAVSKVIHAEITSKKTDYKHVPIRCMPVYCNYRLQKPSSWETIARLATSWCFGCCCIYFLPGSERKIQSLFFELWFIWNVNQINLLSTGFPLSHINAAFQICLLLTECAPVTARQHFLSSLSLCCIWFNVLMLIYRLSLVTASRFLTWENLWNCWGQKQLMQAATAVTPLTLQAAEKKCLV